MSLYKANVKKNNVFDDGYPRTYSIKRNQKNTSLNYRIQLNKKKSKNENKHSSMF